jgi:hypothetical protein
MPSAGLLYFKKLFTLTDGDRALLPGKKKNKDTP